ncbi:type II toxin-antitoxin system RelB/DinJ family antitoxin [Lactobacillus intestinalis]|uniref:type II toxin-antitoxin system RelB/DinJ family antitoxin n=1 Tax=Lactobacillus intestinalis TaxID=151781 RepID=UPI0026E9C6F4|nr:type II toxin-antitoxin system RelB/DinJ family antitoxin [Lactobacillus intestinalis]
MTNNTKRIQANVDKKVARQAENVIAELGLTPTAVINSLYKKIAATGEIPFSFKLTTEQLADIRLREATDTRPIKEIKTKRDLEDFFNED